MILGIQISLLCNCVVFTPIVHDRMIWYQPSHWSRSCIFGMIISAWWLPTSSKFNRQEVKKKYTSIIGLPETLKAGADLSNRLLLIATKRVRFIH